MDTTEKERKRDYFNGIVRKEKSFYYNSSLLLTVLDAHALT